jgi:hypothetical protein
MLMLGEIVVGLMTRIINMVLKVNFILVNKLNPKTVIIMDIKIGMI